MYLLSQLKKLGFDSERCDIIFNAIVISKLQYALPAFYGYLSESSKRKLSAIFHKAKRWQLTPHDYSLEELANALIGKLF